MAEHPCRRWNRGVKELLPLTPEQFERARQRLMRPAPGSRIEAAQKYGVDLTLLVEQLRLTPGERARKLERFSKAIEKVRHSKRAAGREKDLSALPELESLLEGEGPG